MALTREKVKGRRSGNTFLRLIHPLLNHPNFFDRSPRAIKLLIDIASQYRGNNNGDLAATYSMLRHRGWTSNDQINKGLKELLEAGLLIKTRQGRRPRVASLYAITWEPIDECGGKLEVAPTKTAPNTWKQFRFPDHRHAVQSEPPHGAIDPKTDHTLHRDTVHIRGFP